MAVRGWGRSVATATGVAAGAGAAQLGLGYGLGIVAWLPSVDIGGESAWVASLAWATWIVATSVVIGAVAADRLAPSATTDGSAPDARWQPESLLTASLWRLALAAAAAVGGMLIVALIAVPARSATRADTFSPQTIAAGYAMVGAVVGLLMAIWAVASRAAAVNVIATVGWLWLLAVVAVVDSVLAGTGLTSAQLGVWQITADDERYWFRNIYWPGAALSLGSAFIIGAVSAWPAARDARRRIGAAISGCVGPVLIAAAYFLAAPRLVGPRAEQLSAHLLAPYAVIAGLAGSVLVTAIAQRLEVSRQRADRTDADPPSVADGDGTGSAGAGDGSGDADDRQAAPVPTQPAGSPTGSPTGSAAGATGQAPARGTASVSGPGRGRPSASGGGSPS
ncbi:hypothetical protein O7608_04480 [Solwaraspora sp. WMMA2056]|uniref:hypothetical protein n=1 Tax=Solwaraspora sp. WMMA2056 TaxID=3015161 RepID=UPI00259BBE69|nr:hypothetical protein [Solwaraspora sp. WMMA2056]WJK41684.1 hypothetical protein O7608_04480 [Solwaraspora sp. WMMA2056]